MTFCSFLHLIYSFSLPTQPCSSFIPLIQSLYFFRPTTELLSPSFTRTDRRPASDFHSLQFLLLLLPPSHLPSFLDNTSLPIFCIPPARLLIHYSAPLEVVSDDCTVSPYRIQLVSGSGTSLPYPCYIPARPVTGVHHHLFSRHSARAIEFICPLREMEKSSPFPPSSPPPLHPPLLFK